MSMVFQGFFSRALVRKVLQNGSFAQVSSQVRGRFLHPHPPTPKGRQQMGETGFCKNLRFSAVSCENLRFPAVFCANLRLPNPLIYRASRKSAKICKNLRKCAFRVRFLPFAVSLERKHRRLKNLGARTKGY